MFLARLIPGRDPQVYALAGTLFMEPKSWTFVALRRGACAIDYTREQAVQRAKRRLETPRPTLAPRLHPKGASNHVLRLPA